MTHPWRALTRVSILLLVACREQSRADLNAPLPVARRASLALELAPESPTDTLWTATLTLRDQPASVHLGSVTAAVDFDTTRVRFLGDVSRAEQAMRAVHVERGRLRLAGVSVTGLSSENLFRLRFGARDTLALQSMQLHLLEAHAIDATDVRPMLTVAPPRRAAERVP